MRIRRLAVVLVATLAVAGASVSAAVGAASTPTTKGVVLITTNLALENGSAAGTGIVVTKNGEVLTNNHVIRGATTINVIVPSPRRTYTAKVVGYDVVDDVALLKVQASGLATVTRGDSSKLKIGQTAIAVGNANGRGKLVVTRGRITGLGRTIQVRDDFGDVAQLSKLIETSAQLVPGDSGGPLLDASHRVIGVDAAGTSTFAFQGASPGYAIPINRALTIAKQIESGRSSATVHIGDTAFIGLQLSEVDSGLAVQGVVPGSPAEGAGLARGVVITAADGQPLSALDDLRTLLFPKHPGDTITISFTDVIGNPTSATIVLGSGPPQ
jgi:S1-C subfamily serine protease